MGDPLVEERLAYQLPANACHVVAQPRAVARPSRFLDLPRELRDGVYSHDLTKQPCSESEEFGYKSMDARSDVSSAYGDWSNTDGSLVESVTLSDCDATCTKTSPSLLHVCR